MTCFHAYTDFDEKCSQEDDWDVDMSVYYEQGSSIHAQIDRLEVAKNLGQYLMPFTKLYS